MIPEEYVKYGLYGAAGLGLLVELPNIKLGMALNKYYLTTYGNEETKHEPRHAKTC
jgi:hypothetical protein